MPERSGLVDTHESFKAGEGGAAKETRTCIHTMLAAPLRVGSRRPPPRRCGSEIWAERPVKPAV
eukprot:13511475-Alexandrium_andersonii.AAC.1